MTIVERHWMALFQLGGAMGEAARARQLLEAFYFDCKLRNLRPKTLKCYADRLSYLVNHAIRTGTPLHRLDQGQIKRYIAGLIGTVSDETVNGRIRVYRVFFRYLTRDGYIEVDPTESLHLLKTDRTEKEVLRPEQISLILEQCPPTFYGLRDSALLLSMYDGMLRLGETVNLSTTDLYLSERVLFVRKSKSRRSRYVSISPYTTKVLHTYITRYRYRLPGDRLFCFYNGDPLYDMRAYHIIKKAGARAGLNIHPHLLRHSGASQYVANGGPLALLQKSLGHSDIRTTMNYVHTRGADIVNAHDRFGPGTRLPINRR